MTSPKSSPRRARNATGAEVHPEQADRRKHNPPRAWSDGYPNLPERDVLAAITTADARHLAGALDPGAFRGDHDPNGFTCPRCRFFHAEITGPCIWWCPMCDRAGTRYELAHYVACDATAAVRLARLAGVLT
jgi:hypothetical protein